MRSIKRFPGTAILLNDEVCLRVREGSMEHVVLDVMVLAAAAGVTWLLTLEMGECLTVWTTTGTAQVLLQSADGDAFRFTVLAPPAVRVSREEDQSMIPTSWGIPQWVAPPTPQPRSVGVLA